MTEDTKTLYQRLEEAKAKRLQHEAEAKAAKGKSKTKDEVQEHIETANKLRNISAMTSPIGNISTPVDNVAKKFKKDFPSQAAASAAEGLVSGTAKVGSTFTPVEGEVSKAAKKEYEDIAPEVDGFWDRAKKAMMDSLGRGKDGNPTMPQDYFSDYLERKDKKIDASYKEHVLRSTFAALDGVPRDNEGRYLINGMAFTRDELMPSMQREVTAALHPQLMATSGEYRNDYAKSLGFRDFNTYIDETIINPLKALDAEIAGEAVEKANDNTSAFPEANTAIRMGVMADAETKGRKEIRDAIDAMESLKRGDWSAAFAEGFDFLNFATLGVSSLGSDINQLRMLNKVKNGEELTSEEQRMYDIYQITQNANALREIVPQTFWQDIWRNIGTTAQLSSQFMPVMGVASSVANLDKVGVKTGIGLTQRALRQGVVKGVMTGIKQTGRVSGKLGLNVLKANWAGLVVSPLQMGTYSTFLQKREEQFKFVDGKLVYTPTKAWIDVVDTLIEQTNEISSEVLGAGIADVVGVSFKSLGKMIGLDKVINGVSSKLGLGASYNKIFGLKKGDAFKAFERRMSYTGDPVSEGLSEIWGDISTNLMKMCITGTEDFSMLRDPKYWATNLAVAGIYGTTLNMAHSAASLPTYTEIAHLGKAKHQALRNISSKELKDALRIMGVDETVNEAASRLAQLNWSGFSPTDRANAMDFLRAESQQQILIGVNEENNYMARFTPVAASIQQHAYRGKEGDADTGLLYEGTLEDGTKASIISGDMATESNADNLLMVMGKDGSITPMARSKFKEFSAYRMGDVITAEYQRMYGTESIKNELTETEETFEALEQPTPKEAMEYMRKLNIPIPEEGGKVKLVDGRGGMFLGWNADGSLNVEAQKADGTYELLVMPFHKILSAQGNIAQVQQEMLAGKTLSAAEEAIETETPEAEVNPEAETPEGAQVETATAIEEAQNEVADISAVPMTEDGNVDFEAITDPALYAKMYVRELGSTEVAIDDVSKMRSMAEQSILKLEEKRETLATANERIANRKEVEAMKARIAFYDAVLDTLSPKETMAEPVADTPEVEAPAVETPVAEVETPTMETPTFYEGDIVEHNGRKAEVVENRGDGTYIIDYKMADNASNQDIDIVDGTSLTKSQDEVEAAENTVGIVDNAESRKIADDVYDTVNRIAKSLGITVEFVPIVVNSAGQAVNGLINGKKVLISSQFATECVNWLTGHEFLHYMKSVAPEQYAKYTESVKNYLGEEEWNKRMEKQKALYLNHKMTEKANNEALMTEECVADFTGEMVEENDAFNNYLNTVKEEKGLLAAIKRVLRAIGKLFTGKHNKRVNEMLKQVNALIAAAEKANTEGVNVDAQAPIEVIESAERLEEKGGVVDVQRGDAKFALADVLTISEQEQAIQDLMRVTGRSRATVQKYIKAEQSLARFILSGDNAAYLDYEADDSVPSIWENSDYPQGTVEFSNICRKRLPLTMIYQKLQKEFPNTKFNKTQLETIRQTLIANGIDVACGLCFVEDRRQHNDEIGQGFIDALSGKDVYVNANQQKAIDKLRESGDNYIPNLYELLTLDGMKKLRMEHPDVANAFIKYNNARGQQAGRLFQAYSAYHREILKFNNARVKKTNDVGGLRIFSFSDFEAHHLIDLVQVLTDCARKGIKVQGYTKVPEFALAVKDTGMKLNRSLIAKDNGVVEADYSPKTGEAVSPNVIDGKRLLLDTVEGIDVTDKNFFDSSTSKNVGNILVGVNDEQIRIAMLDPFVDYIIPFHTGLSADILKQKGISDWKNYKYEQIEKTIVDGKMVNAKTHINIYTDVLSDDIKTEKQFVERYLEVCKEKNLVPKFARFLNRDKAGDFVYTKGYYKFLLDFKMFDAKGRILPQEVVQPIFNDEVNKQILDDYVKGEKAKAPNEKVYEEVKEALGLGGQPKYSLAYHGSGANFDKFDHSFMSSGEGQQIFGWGTYVSEVEDIAKTYAEASGKPNNIGHLITGLKHRISAITQNIEHLNKRIDVYAKDAEYVDRLNAQKAELQKEISKAESEISRLESLNVEQGKILYTVDIPDNTGDNYIEYDKPVSKGIRSKVNKALDEYNEIFVDDMRESLGVDNKMSDQEVLGLLRSNISMTSGKEMYADLSRELGGDKEASLFLADAGVVGISYPAEATTGGRADNARNYVIFNADEVKIIEKTRYSLSDTSAYQASAELSVMLGGYKSKHIPLSGLVKAVENIAKKYSKGGLLEIALKEYDNGDTKEFINALKGFVSVYPPTMLRDYSGDKTIFEETFGGIWIEDTEEFAKFVSAVNKSPFEEDGEGIAYTDNYFYAYYRNINGEPVPYASVYMNEAASQDVVNAILKKIKDEGDRDIRGWFDRVDEGVRNVESENNVISGADKESSNTSANGKMGAKLSRKGRYFDNPSLYVKTSRADRGNRVNYSLITPEMDASYLDAVERGDMATAQRMVMEAAKLAMPNTKVVDEDGNPNVVYHGTPNNFNAFSKEMFGTSTDRGIWGNGFYFSDSEQYAKTYEKRGDKQGKTLSVFLNIKRPLFISLRNGGNEGAMYFHELMEKHFTDDIYEDVTRTDELMSVAQERLTADIVANGYDGIVVEYTNHIDTEYIAFEPNQIKSADTVTYDDNGNVIPLSERFNPEKKDIRYSLSNRPTGLLNDFTEEFEALQKEYESLDPATIHTQHPFRIRKRKVVQKYLNHVSEVLGLPCEVFVLDSSNEQQMRTAYRKYVASRQSNGKTSVVTYEEFKEEVHNANGGYFNGSNLTIINIDGVDTINTNSEYLGSILHENAHKIIEGMGVDEKVLEAIYEEAQNLAEGQVKNVEERYTDASTAEKGEEIITFALQTRASFASQKDMLMQFFEGKVSEDDILKSFNFALPLRDRILKDILIALRDGYNNKHNNEFNNDNGGETKEGTNNDRLRGEHLRPSARGGLLSDTRYSLPDMPFFEDNGDIVSFEAMTPEERKMAKYEDAQRMASEGADAQAILDATGWLETEDGWEYFGEADIDLTGDKDEMLRVGRWLESKRAVKKNGIRKMYAELIKEQRDVINDIKKREAEASASRGTIKAQVEAFLQGQAPESLSVEDQVLVDIARGQRLKWKDGNGKRGLSTELGLTNARAEKMGAVTIGATDYLEDYVAALMERNNGYDNDINDNDIRNAVIEMFRSYPSPKRALDELYGRYATSTAVSEAEEGLYRLEVERDNALAEIDAEHNATMANFEANPAPFIREYNESASWQAEIDLYTNSLRKAKSAIDRMTAGRATESANRKSKAEAVRSLKTFINNMLRGDLARYTHKRDIVALMNAVNESTTIYQMQRAVNKAMESAYNIRLRKEVARMNNLTKMRIVLNETNLDPQIFLSNMVRDGKMTARAARAILNNYWRGVNASGVAIAKGVDGDTSEIMAFIHENIDLAKLGEKTVAEKCKDLRDAVEGDRTLDEDLKAKKIASVDIIEEYLTLQQMINALREINGSEKPIEQTIAQQATEIAKLNNELRALEMQKEAITRTDRGYKSRKTAIEEKLAELRNAYNTARMAQEQAYASYYGSMPDIIERLYQANTSVEKLLKDGIVELSRQKQAEVDHRNELIRMALEDIDRPEALVSDKVDYTLAQKAHDSVVGRFVTSQLNSLDHMLRRAGENAPNGEGRLWKYFVPKLLDAYNRLFDEQQACADIMNKKCKQLFGKDYNKTMMKAESVVIGTRDEVVNGKVKTTDVTIAQALNIIATWDQADGRASLEKQGITEEKIQELIEKLYANNPKWMAFEQWVVHTFLPSRREKYNKVHRSMFGVNMNKEINYFPIRRKKDDLYQNVDLTEANFDVLPSTITGSIIQRTKSTAKIDLDNSFFEVLRDHIVDMEKWAEMAPITKDFNTMLSSKAVQAVMNAKGKHFLGQFKEAAKIATLNFTGNSPEYEKIFMPIVNRMWASSLLAFKPYTALKQLASSVMFAQYSADPCFVGRLLYYYVGGLAPLPDSVFLRIGKGEVEPQPQKGALWNIQWAKKNSAMFRERWESVAAGNEAFTRQIKYDTKLGKFVGEGIKDFTTLGMRMIAFVDAYTSAAGMRAVYDVTYRNLKEKGASHEEAHREAMLRAEIAVNKTQQSSQFIYLSPIQMSRGIESMLATFNNAPFAQGRLIAESWAELIRNPEEERRVIVNEEAEWLKAHQYARAYAEIEEQIAAEKANGTLSAEDENKRREELQRVLNASIRAIAEKKAPKIMRGHKVRAALALTINAYIAQFAFNAMEVLPYMLFGDDDEKKKQLLKDVALWSLAGPLSTIPLGNAVISAFKGYDFQPLGAYGDLVDDVNQIVKEAQKNGFDADVALMTADFLARKAVGVDYKTYFNLYAGLDSLVEDGYSHEALLKMLNAPNSQVRLLAGERREGETIKQSITRILRLYAILDDNIYEDNYGDGEYTGDNRPVTMSKAQMRNLMPDSEREYRSDVLRRKAGYIKRAEIDAIDEEYAKVMEAMGWTANRRPNKKAFESGKYEAPVSGVRIEEYRKLASLATRVANAYDKTSRYIGDDEGKYYDYILAEMERKQQMISEFNKAINTK